MHWPSSVSLVLSVTARARCLRQIVKRYCYINNYLHYDNGLY